MMDESSFETFEEELGKPLREAPTKPLFQTRRSELHTQRMREESQIAQQMPKAVPHESLPSRGMSLHKALSIQNLAQIEAPWEGVTLNRCLLVALTILILTSGCQRLHEAVRGRRDGADAEPTSTTLYTRQAGLRRGRLAPPQPETSLWETFFWWVTDDDEEEGRRRGKSRKVTRERASRGLRHKPILDRKLLKQREEGFKTRRGKPRKNKQESPERAKEQKDKDKQPKPKNLDVEEQVEEKTTKKMTVENQDRGSS